MASLWSSISKLFGGEVSQLDSFKKAMGFLPDALKLPAGWSPGLWDRYVFGGSGERQEALEEYRKSVGAGQEVVVPAVTEALTLEQMAAQPGCLMAIHGLVFDAKEFAEEHPGGPDVLLELKGKDATAAFDDVCHSQVARNMTLKLWVAPLRSPPAAPGKA